MNKKPIKVALLGSRGIPAKYGAFERFVQDLDLNLSKDRFVLYVACESSLKREKVLIPGVQLVYFPVFDKFRIISEVLYDILALIWSSLKDLDIVYLLGYAASPFCLVPRIFGKIVIVNVDGLEWKRAKFPKPIRFLLKILEMIASRAPNYIVSDSKAIQLYYRYKYNVNSFYIPYSADIIVSSDEKLIEKFGLKKYEYYTVVARIEPENNIELIVKGFKMSTSSKKLVVIGPLKNLKYAKKVLSIKDDRIIFLGGIYDQRILNALRHNCFAYIHGHEVGGTNPSLLEALGCGNVVIALDVPFNKEVARDAGIYFKKDPADLARKIAYLEQCDHHTITLMRKKAVEIIKHFYTKEKIIDAYQNLFINLKMHKTRR
jgi:rhamnosyltransferase